MDVKLLYAGFRASRLAVMDGYHRQHAPQPRSRASALRASSDSFV